MARCFRAAFLVDPGSEMNTVTSLYLGVVGIGLISTPATESIMHVLPPARAGIGSAVNDATRELGSTLGVARCHGKTAQ
jgi:hypothetical protein